MNNENDTDDISREFVRQIFGQSNKVEITDQGISADDLNTLFSTND